MLWIWLTSSDLLMYFGAHNARAPATNATHVKPIVDSMKLLLKHTEKLLLKQTHRYRQNEIKDIELTT